MLLVSAVQQCKVSLSGFVEESDTVHNAHERALALRALRKRNENLPLKATW